MKVALVQHKVGEKCYWFRVPKRLENRVKQGSPVVCATRRGRQPGIVVGNVVDDQDIRDIMRTSGATYPLKPIVSVSRSVPMKEIKIPDYMKATNPRPEKIARRLSEFYQTGTFHTNIVVDTKGRLIDGYSAYLVAKALGLHRLPVTNIE